MEPGESFGHNGAMVSLHRLAAVLVLAVLVAPAAAGEDERTVEARARMVAEIEHIARSVGPVGDREVIAPEVLEAMGRVERHLFVPEMQRHRAYADRPLPIGYGQTISQPYIVALMSDLLDVGEGAKVLELGTGSGYQGAVLGAMGVRVYTIEIVPELAEQAAQRLAGLGYRTVTARQGDGYYGWPDHAPFDAIVVTAAASHVPGPLVEQLKAGGRMVIPVGGPFFTQSLLLIEKTLQGEVTTRHLLPVRFVPLTGGH